MKTLYLKGGPTLTSISLEFRTYHNAEVYVNLNKALGLFSLQNLPDPISCPMSILESRVFQTQTG